MISTLCACWVNNVLSIYTIRISPDSQVGFWPYLLYHPRPSAGCLLVWMADMHAYVRRRLFEHGSCVCTGRQSLHSRSNFLRILIEPGHSISYNIACAFSEDSNQPVYLHSLIRVFAVRLRTLWILGYPQCVHRSLWSECSDWSESSLGTHAI